MKCPFETFEKLLFEMIFVLCLLCDEVIFYSNVTKSNVFLLWIGTIKKCLIKPKSDLFYCLARKDRY